MLNFLYSTYIVLELKLPKFKLAPVYALEPITLMVMHLDAIKYDNHADTTAHLQWSPCLDTKQQKGRRQQHWGKNNKK